MAILTLIYVTVRKRSTFQPRIKKNNNEVKKKSHAGIPDMWSAL